MCRRQQVLCLSRWVFIFVVLPATSHGFLKTNFLISRFREMKGAPSRYRVTVHLLVQHGLPLGWYSPHVLGCSSAAAYEAPRKQWRWQPFFLGSSIKWGEPWFSSSALKNSAFVPQRMPSRPVKPRQQPTFPLVYILSPPLGEMWLVPEFGKV